MADNLYDRAGANRDALVAVADEVGAALGAARRPIALDGAGEPIPRPDVDATVTAVVAAAVAESVGDAPDVTAPFLHPDDWEETWSPADHLAIARGCVAGIRDAIDAVNDGLGGRPTPALAGGLGDRLRSLLASEAELVVALRRARERTEATAGVVETLGALSAQIEPEIREAEAYVAWAKTQQQDATALVGALAVPPLDTIVADAGAVLAGATFTAADNRLDALLPTELRDRAAARWAEAAAVGDRAATQAGTSAIQLAALDTAARPVDAAATLARQRFVEALAAMAGYQSRGPKQLTLSVELLEGVARHEDLDAAVATAISAANNADGVDGVAAEADLATALAALAAAEDDVADALLAARTAAPDDDPEADAAVTAARAALADPGIQQPVADARAALDAAASAALSRWEAEVPDSVWHALDDFESAKAMLEHLANQQARTDLGTELDAAQDALADAVDDRGTHLRSRWRAGLADARRRAVARSADRTGGDRTDDYLRGRGVGGRTTHEQ